MDSLPVLAANEILIHLDVADLLVCSLVSVSWRSVVNSDPKWKQMCFKISDNTTINYLCNVHSKILPEFPDTESKNKRLVSVCYWRVVYMKLQHLKRNWRRGNHETYSVTDLAFNHFDLKIDNDLLVTNVNDNQCEVWNIKNVPRRQETINCALNNTRCKCMINLHNDRLVIVQDTLLQIYHRKEKRFGLCYRRLFNKPQTASENIPGSLKIDEWYNEAVSLRPTHLQAFNVGKYFIGVALNGTFENAVFHVWDTSTGEKVKEELVRDINPQIKDSVYNVKFCPPKSDLGKILVCVQHSRQTGSLDHDHFYTVLHMYDFSTLCFKTLKVLKPHVPWIYFEDKLIITIGHNQVKLSIYSSLNGEKLASKNYEEIINPDSVQVHKDLLGFTTGGYLVVLSVKDFSLVFTTTIVKFSSNLFGFDFVLLDCNLVLIACWDNVNKIEVWSIEDKRSVSTLGVNGLMFPCNNFAKFFVWNEMVTTIYMLQFW